jgi:nitroreductase
MNLNLSADEVLRTTRAVRKRLDFDKPIPDAVLRECLEIATQAPTGSNSQSWRFVVVTDPEKIAGLAALYNKGWSMYANMDGANAQTVYQGLNEMRIAQQGRVLDSANYLAEHMHRVPAMLVPVSTAKLDGMPNIMSSSTLGGIIPAAWSFCLAARERGLGTAWTTLHLMFEEQAAEILGIPFATTSQVALITIGYTKGTDFKPATREPLDTVAYWNTWPQG